MFLTWERLIVIGILSFTASFLVEKWLREGRFFKKRMSGKVTLTQTSDNLIVMVVQEFFFNEESQAIAVTFNYAILEHLERCLRELSDFKLQGLTLDTLPPRFLIGEFKDNTLSLKATVRGQDESTVTAVLLEKEIDVLTKNVQSIMKAELQRKVLESGNV